MVDARTRRMALLVSGCFFLENLDATIVTTAAPVMARSLHVPAGAVGLVVTAYLLALATFLPVSAWFAARWGPRAVMVTAIVVFTVASAGCALAQSLPQLVALRVVQGIGGAMMVPVGRSLVLGRTAREDLVRVMAWLTWPGLLAPVVAPLVGGLIVTVTSWRAIFVVNLPLGVAALVGAWVLLPPVGQDAPAARPLDRLGVLLTGAGLAGAAWTAHLASVDRLSPVLAVWAVLSLVALVAAVVHLRTTAHPLVDLTPLRVRTLRTAIVGSSLQWQVVGAVPFLLPLLVQQVFGWTPLASGALVLTVFLGNVGIKPVTTPVLHRWGFRPVLVTASVGVAVSAGALAAARAWTPVAVLVLVCVVGGALRSLGFTAYATMAMADVERADVPSANVLVVTFQQMSAAFAIAVASLGLRLGELLTGHSSATSTGPYEVTFVLLAVIALGAAANALSLPADAGDAVRRGAARR